jgi:prolyl 4-hydroxylase
VNVAQDVDEEWPLEVYDRLGEAINITMQPFDMLFYESHSLIHGRPYVLKGRYYANIFIHFEAMEESLEGGNMQQETNERLPPYILPGSPVAEEWLADHPLGWSKVRDGCDVTTWSKLAWLTDKSHCRQSTRMTHLGSIV